MINSKKADFKFLLVVVLGLIVLVFMTGFFIGGTEKANDIIVDQFSDEYLSKFFDLPLDDTTGAIKYNAISELDKFIVDYTTTIIHQIFDPEYQMKDSTSKNLIYENSKKHLRYYDFFPTIDKSKKNYGIQFIDDGKGIKVYIISETSQPYFFTDYKTYSFLENKHLGIVMSGRIYDDDVKCTSGEKLVNGLINYASLNKYTGEACKDEDRATFEAFAVTWLFAKYKPFDYLNRDSFMTYSFGSSESFTRIQYMKDIWKNAPIGEYKRNPEDVSQYIVPVSAMEITTNKDNNEYPEIAWRRYSKDINVLKERNVMYAEDLLGHLVLILNLDDSKTISRHLNKQFSELSIDEEKSEYLVFFPTVRVASGPNPDVSVTISDIGGKITIDGIGYLQQHSVKTIIQNINKFK